MKGEAENIDISNEIIDSLIDKTNTIYTVQFVGGEPMLAINKTKYFLEAARKKEVVIFGMSLVTNGTILLTRQKYNLKFAVRSSIISV